MTSKMNGKTRFVRCPKCRNVLPEPTDVPVYKCGGCNATLQAKKRNNNTVNTTTQKPDDDSLEKQKVERVFGDQDQNSDRDEDNDAVNKAVNDSIRTYLFGNLKMKQISDDDHEAETSSSSNQRPPVNNVHNDPRSSTELSGHDDPDSSPEANGNNRLDQEQEQKHDEDQDRYLDAGKNQEKSTVDATSIDSIDLQINKLNDECLNQELTVDSINGLDRNDDHDEPRKLLELPYRNRFDEDYEDDHDQEFLSCRNDVEFEESGSEFDEAFANTRNFKDSDGCSNSKSSFKSLIAEKLLDTRLKKPVHIDEHDMLSEDESVDLHHHRRFDRIDSIKNKETTHFRRKRDYEYKGSVSSFDGTDNHVVRKHRLASIGDENVGSKSGYRFNRSRMISENPKMERIELLKMVKELQDELERTSIANPQHVPVRNNHVPIYPGRYGQRMAFSGETTAVNRRLDGGPCHHCHPQDRRFSAQIPRQHICCNRPHFEPNAYYSPLFSAQSSPIRNQSEPEYSTPNDYRNRSDVIKHVRSPKKKRYVRPIANASPWIACYRCSKILELPQSFLVFNKKYHSLQCGACSKVLNFTLSNWTHVSRYYPEKTIAAPPSSKVEDYDRLNGPWAGPGPVSCSDNSFQKSYSTETDRIGSRDYSEKRKGFMSRDPSGSTHPSSSKASGQRNMTSGTRVEPRLNGSPLHRLMGYSTVSKVIRE